MTKDDAKLMIELLAQMVRNDDELKRFFIQELSRAVKVERTHKLSTKQAAVRLGKSVSWLYKNKHKFNYVKNGNSKSDCLYFDEDSLCEYE